ncbi:MAG: succinate dehydrogenase assembly factor 2 [Methylotenera sp.]|nr:succinate dehydrogenase assembly factor 2 [Methylotenera sp.]
MTELEIRRLSWRCRRGLLELDIVLQRFAEYHLATLDADELAAFDSLLDSPDNAFLDVVTNRIEAASAGIRETMAMQRLLAKLRNNLN